MSRAAVTRRAGASEPRPGGPTQPLDVGRKSAPVGAAVVTIVHAARRRPKDAKTESRLQDLSTTGVDSRPTRQRRTRRELWSCFRQEETQS
jgi:hypothetical protein